MPLAFKEPFRLQTLLRLGHYTSTEKQRIERLRDRVAFLEGRIATLTPDSRNYHRDRAECSAIVWAIDVLTSIESEAQMQRVLSEEP